MPNSKAQTSACLNCGREPAPGSPLGLCSHCLVERLLDPVEDQEVDEANSTESRKYDSLGELARGGMGSILRVKDRTLGRNVAMKVMLASRDVGDEARRRFTREALVLARLDHPNIVPIHEMGTDEEGRPFYTMKLVEGETLQAVINRLSAGEPKAVRDYPLDRLLTIFRKICDGIAFAHDRGIIHRDLKPDNIMVGRFGEVLIMDWGLAKFMNSQEKEVEPQDLEKTRVLGQWSGRIRGWSDPEFKMVSTDVTMDGSVVGTPRYMSPEQARGLVDRMDQRSDLFSMGAILYSILTLRPPVDGADLEEILLNIAKANITPPSALQGTRISTRTFRKTEAGPQAPAALVPLHLPHCPRGRVPTALSAVCMHALQRKPEDRYQNVAALAAEVEAYQGGFATAAEQAGALSLLWLWVRRHKVISLSAVLIACLSVAFAFKIMASERKATGNAERAEYEAKKATTAERGMRRALGQAKIALAEAAYRDADAARMKSFLNEVPEDLRDSNWRYLQAQTDQSIARYPAARGSTFTDIASHPTQPGVFVLADDQGGVTILDAGAGRVVGAFETGPIRRAACLAVSSDGERVAIACGGQGRIAVHQLPAGKKLVEWETKEPGFVGLQFAPDGALLANSSDLFKTQLFDSTSGKRIWRNPMSGQAVFYPDGKKLFTRFREEIAELDASNGQIRLLLGTQPHMPRQPSFSRDGHQLLLPDAGGFVRLFETGTTNNMREFKCHKAGVIAAALSPDNRHLIAFGSDISGLNAAPGGTCIRILDARLGTPLQTLLGVSPGARCMAVDARTGLFVTGGDTANVWRLQTGREQWQITSQNSAEDTAFWDSEHSVFAPLDNFQVTIRDLRLGAEARPTWMAVPGHAFARLAVSGDGHRAVVVPPSNPGKAHAPIHVLNLSDPLRSTTHAWENKAQTIRLVRLDETGSRLFIHTVPRAEVLDLPGTNSVALDTSEARGIADALFLEDGHKLLGIITPRGRNLTEAAKRRLALWDADSGKFLSFLPLAESPQSLASVGDPRAFLMGMEDGTVRLCDFPSLQPRAEFRAHDGAVTALTFHRVSHMLATGSRDLSVKVWESPGGRLLDAFYGLGAAPSSLGFSPSGGRLICGGGDKVARVWDLERVTRR